MVHVLWAWIAIPTILPILTVLFLIMTALQSRAKGLHVWKSSTVPLLCSGLYQKVQQEIRALGDVMQMVDLTNTVQARYVESEDGTWILDTTDTTCMLLVVT